jgi:hypothetical protein
MGGSGSGRSGGRPTIEGCAFVLDINRLHRSSCLVPEATCASQITWPGEDDSVRLTVALQARLAQQSGTLTLAYEHADYWTGRPQQIETTIRLVATAQPFGGHRWWFVCPRTGRRVTKFYLPFGAPRFSSRHAYRLAYQSQRETPSGRALYRAFKLRRRLGSQGGVGERIRKPKGMHRSTFAREMAKVEAAESVCDTHLANFVERLTKRSKRA